MPLASDYVYQWDASAGDFKLHRLQDTANVEPEKPAAPSQEAGESVPTFTEAMFIGEFGDDATIYVLKKGGVCERKLFDKKQSDCTWKFLGNNRILLDGGTYALSRGKDWVMSGEVRLCLKEDNDEDIAAECTYFRW